MAGRLLGFYTLKEGLHFCNDNKTAGKNRSLSPIGLGRRLGAFPLKIRRWLTNACFFLAVPLKHREVFCSPLIAPISLGKYLDTGLIKCVNVGGEMAPKAEVRPIKHEWVEALYLEAQERNVEFYFHQCASMFLKNGVNIGKWNLNEQIKRAEEVQHELERSCW